MESFNHIDKEVRIVLRRCDQDEILQRYMNTDQNEGNLLFVVIHGSNQFKRNSLTNDFSSTEQYIKKSRF